jgi:hypothetical protein
MSLGSIIVAQRGRGSVAPWAFAVALALSGGGNALAARAGGTLVNHSPSAVGSPAVTQPQGSDGGAAVSQAPSIFSSSALAHTPPPSAGPTVAQTPAQCEYPANLATDTQIRVGQLKGRALVEITRPNSVGRKVEVEYGEELYSQKFGPDGRVRVGFALTAATNTFLVTMSETKPITCTVSVPDFNKFYRAVLRWRDPVQLDLNVIEPGARIGESGHVSGSRPNGNLTQGIGQMDIVSGVPTEGSTAEISYVVTDVTSIPQNSMFAYKLDYVTRGARPEAPYCEDAPLSAPQFELITIENGTVNTRKMSVNHAQCGEKMIESRRLMPIR